MTDAVMFFYNSNKIGQQGKPLAFVILHGTDRFPAKPRVIVQTVVAILAHAQLQPMLMQTDTL